MNRRVIDESAMLKAQFLEDLTERGQQITRRRPGNDSNNYVDTLTEYRVFLDNPPPRPLYPQTNEMGGAGENMANAERHLIQFLPECDILEGDYIIFKTQPRHTWEIEKDDIPTAFNDEPIYGQCQIKRAGVNL